MAQLQVEVPIFTFMVSQMATKSVGEGGGSVKWLRHYMGQTLKLEDKK